MKCTYCGFQSFSSPMYVVKEATKPKGSPNRWRFVGHCCEDCESSGKKLSSEFNYRRSEV